MVGWKRMTTRQKSNMSTDGPFTAEEVRRRLVTDTTIQAGFGCALIDVDLAAVAHISRHTGAAVKVDGDAAR